MKVIFNLSHMYGEMEQSEREMSMEEIYTLFHSKTIVFPARKPFNRPTYPIITKTQFVLLDEKDAPYLIVDLKDDKLMPGDEK